MKTKEHVTFYYPPPPCYIINISLLNIIFKILIVMPCKIHTNKLKISHRPNCKAKTSRKKEDILNKTTQDSKNKINKIFLRMIHQIFKKHLKHPFSPKIIQGVKRKVTI